MAFNKEQIEILKQYKLFIRIAVGFFLVKSIMRTEDNRMSIFRDKSALFGRELAPGEPPSWPVGYSWLSWIPYP